MDKGVLTSVRLPQPLKTRLDEMAHRINRRRNWIISEALREYMNHDNAAFAAQIREESLKAAELERNPDVWNQSQWEESFDLAGWK